jgi:hypothetical protein
MRIEQKGKNFLDRDYGVGNQMNEGLEKTDYVDPQAYFLGHHLIFLGASKMKSIKC